MDILSAMENRHSVRRYKNMRIEGEKLRQLLDEINCCNAESGLNIQLVTDEPQAFSGIIPGYGFLRGVRNYVALIGLNDKSLYEKCGYYGEKIVLKAQQLGLNTCWVGGTYKKSKVRCTVYAREKLTAVIAIGYGENNGQPRKTKPADKLSNIGTNTPDWFEKGVKAATLAPTALNQQKFYLEFTETGVKATARPGPYAEMDLGIVKYHFEVASGKDKTVWI